MNSSHPILLAVTGGIACGKSEAGRLLASGNVQVLDTDSLAHELMRKGRPVHQRVVETFGDEILAPDGEIDRAALGAQVFADARKRETLNGLVHPAVMEAADEWAAHCRAADEDAAVLVPLLFETGWTTGWDAVVCIAANEETVFQRLEKRGLSREEARRRIAAQMPLKEKTARADFVIENNGTLEELSNALSGILAALRGQQRNCI